MTSIAVALTDNQCVIMSESGITDESFHTAPPMRKIVRQGDWLIAAAGADRVCDVLQFVTKYPVVPPKLKNEKDETLWYQWIAKRVIPIIRKALQDELTLDTEHGVAELPDSEFLLITHGKCFSISATLGISSCKPYWAIGSGGGLALGSLSTAFHTSDDWKTNHDIHLFNAVETAVRHDSFSHPPIYGYVSKANGKIQEWHSTDPV
jgi:hypothetical protein